MTSLSETELERLWAERYRDLTTTVSYTLDAVWLGERVAEYVKIEFSQGIHDNRRLLMNEIVITTPHSFRGVPVRFDFMPLRYTTELMRISCIGYELTNERMTTTVARHYYPDRL